MISQSQKAHTKQQRTVITLDKTRVCRHSKDIMTEWDTGGSLKGNSFFRAEWLKQFSFFQLAESYIGILLHQLSNHITILYKSLPPITSPQLSQQYITVNLSQQRKWHIPHFCILKSNCRIEITFKTLESM